MLRVSVGDLGSLRVSETQRASARGRAFRALLVSALAVTVAVLASGCSGGGGGACDPPTLAQCQDPVWLDSDPCGVEAREAMRTDSRAECTRLLAENSKEVTKDLPQEQVLLPAELGGGVGQVVPVPNAGERPSNVLLPLTHSQHAQATAAGATEQGLSAADQALRAQWNANGNRVASCREYVYERHYDYSLFEDAVAAHFSNPVAIVERLYGPATDAAALGTRGLGGASLKSKDGTGAPVQAPQQEYVVDIEPDGDCYQHWGKIFLDNVFAAMPREFLEPGEWEQYGLRDWRCGKFDLESGSWIPPTPRERWQWHQTARENLAATGKAVVEAEALYPTVREFAELLAAYRANVTSTNPDEDLLLSHQARLRELFDVAVGAGCLAKGTTLCSWSPSYLVDLLRADLQNMKSKVSTPFPLMLDGFAPTMEADFQKCVDHTGEDFTALASFQFKMPDGLPWPEPLDCGPRVAKWRGCYTCAMRSDWPTCPADDYAASTTALDRFFQRVAEHALGVELYGRDIRNSMPRDLFDVEGKLRLPGAQVTERHEAGNDRFGVFYEYQLGYGLPGLDTAGSNVKKLCEATPQAVGSFTAGGWAFGPNRVEFIDARVEAGIEDLVDAHLDVLGVRVWNPPSLQALVSNSQFAVAKDVVGPTTYRFAVPAGR